MNYNENHPKCWTCKHLRDHSVDSEIHNGRAIVWYDCSFHTDHVIDEPQFQYCSEHNISRGGKHDAAHI